MDSRPTSSLPTDIYGLIIRFLDVGDIIVLRQVSTIVQGTNYYLVNQKLIEKSSDLQRIPRVIEGPKCLG